ncbi:MAG: GcrA family cell cycle regulator [Magnetospiraceae bacterium]
MDWTEERIETLKELWTDGLPAGEIGRRLGVTKNAVVGKVHRLGLPKRPSPIKGAASAGSSTPAPAPKKKPAPVKTLIDLAALKPGMCCWPIGDPGAPDFHFCGGRAISGKPYCEEHCARAYVRPSKGGGGGSSQSSGSAGKAA